MDSDILIGDRVFAILMRYAKELEREQATAPTREPTDRQVEVLGYVADNPGKTTLEIAAALDRSPRTMFTYLDTLRRAGRIRGEGGKPNRWYAR